MPEFPGYQILCELGCGGMGVVYKAIQSGLNRIVAPRRFPAGVSYILRTRLDLKAEVEAIARLQHPNLIQVFEVGEHEGLSVLLDGISGRRQP